MQFSANAAAADGIGAYQLLPISSDASRPAGAEEVEKLEQYVKKLGGIIRTATPAWKILTTDDGHVSGVAAADGKNRFTFRAKSVVLASGGFAADLMKVTSRQPRWAVYVERAGAAKNKHGRRTDNGPAGRCQGSFRQLADGHSICPCLPRNDGRHARTARFCGRNACQ